MDEVNIKLSVQEVNMVIKSLSQLPYHQVHEIIAKIHEQANEQVKKNTDQKK